MNNQNLSQDAVSRLAAQAAAIGRLAQDSGGFAATLAAFESRDPNAFGWVLQRLELVPQCELICEWVGIKLGVLRCLEVCGPPLEKTELPNLQQFARAIVQLTSNEKLLGRVVNAVACGDGEDYQAAISELKLNNFCHLICHWVYAIVFRRICEVVCSRQPVQLPDALNEVRAAGITLANFTNNEKAFDTINKAASSLNCKILQTAINQAGFAVNCEIICRLICTWRCVWVCRELCQLRPPVLTGVYGIEEARNFALASQQIASQPRALGALVSAVQSRDAKAYDEIISRFGLAPYCLQVCAWVCSVSCHEFCICVCPPQQLFPQFTQIGGLEYATQIDSVVPATGLTVGATQAFFSTLRLNGILTQLLAGMPLEYCFEYIPVTRAGTTLAAVITATDTSLTVASSTGFPAVPFNAVIGSAGSYNVTTNVGTPGYEIVTVTKVTGTTWTVTRGAQGTTPAPAVVGATIATGAVATGSWTQVPTGWITRTVIGSGEVFVPTPLPGHWTFPDVAVNPNPGDIPAPFTADGWIQVPQGSDIFLNGNMINLDSTLLPSFPPQNETGVSASNPANHPLANDLYFGLRMRVRQAGSATNSDGGTCSVVAIDNTLYNNVNHHPEWDGGSASGQYGIAMIDIKELQAAGCAGITNSLTVLFTAAHPNLGSVSINMIGPGGPYNFTLPTPLPETGDWYGTPTNDFVLANLTPCAYIVTLSVTLLLTTGDSDFPGPLIDQIAFCLT